MLNLFKPNKTETVSRKSFNKMQQLLFDAQNYANEGHIDIAAILLRSLSVAAVKQANEIDPLTVPDFENDPDAYVAYLERACDAIHDANGSLREAIQKRKAAAGPTIKDIEDSGASVTVDWPRQAENRFYREPEPTNQGVETNRCKIQQGECVSDRGTDHCGHCVDHCEASDYRKEASANG